LLKEIGRPEVAHNIDWHKFAKQHPELIRTVDKQKSPEVKLRGIETFK
jgi:hypothetical protein